LNILFICTGNTCRSPMAEAMARRVLADKGIRADVRSRGLSVTESAASEYAAEAVKAYGLNLRGHVPRQVSGEALAWADICLTMTRAHKSRAAALGAKNVYTIREYADGTGPDVRDPYGGGAAEYAACAEQLYGLITKAADKLKLEISGREIKTDGEAGAQCS